ncbi:hypothetical protein [Serratia fonticola]
MTTPQIFAAECASEYERHRAQAALRERGSIARNMHVQLAWMNRQERRYWLAQ